ncbi:hypothetical protein BC833DRAFT_596476 [Globomyces pollinis-pini]|nr:hypothetical protein BC833DRAFT_596476 [Globomyces pollinis-pini]
MYTPEYYTPVKFTPINRIFITISSILFDIGFLSNATLIYVFFRNYHTSTSCYEKCICFLLFCELVWTIPFSIQYTYMVIIGESLGFEGCQWMGIILPIVSGTTAFAHAILAIDRYFAIILEKPAKPKQIIILSSIYAPIIGFLSITPLFLGTGYALNDNHFCAYNFKSTNTFDLMFIRLTFAVFLTVLSVILYCYLKIFVVTNKKKIDVKKDSTRDRLNRKIFHTCIAVLLCFSICYTPINITFIAQSFFNYDFPDIIKHISTTICISDCVLTPLCLFLLAPTYQQGFRKHVYDYRDSKTTRSSVSSQRRPSKICG